MTFSAHARSSSPDTIVLETVRRSGESERSRSTAGLVPTSCTAGAVALFTDGLDQYDDIREKFLAWRDWGANGLAYPAGAPREARETFAAAVAELEANCPG